MSKTCGVRTNRSTIRKNRTFNQECAVVVLAIGIEGLCVTIIDQVQTFAYFMGPV